MNVDLPAPLSPSRQWHSPACTATETPAKAMTAPKCFSIFCSAISDSSSVLTSRIS